MAYDERRIHSVTAKYAGWVERLYVDYTGRGLRRGEPLMEVYSPELIATAEEYLLALRQRARLGANSLATVRAGAEELVRSARQRLRYFDIGEREIDAIARHGQVRRTLTIVAPVSGIVIEKAVFQGTQIAIGAPLFKVADVSRPWIIADVFPYELAWVQVGNEAEITLSYLPGEVLHGRVTYLYPYLTSETRTARVRLELTPTQGRTPALRPDMFATVVIKPRGGHHGVVVPEQAIIRTGARALAVVALGRGYFEPREVRLGAAAEGKVEILEGLRPGDQLVTSSQFLIDSESNLRAAVATLSRPAEADAARSGTPRAPATAPAGGGSEMEDMPGMGKTSSPAGHEHQRR